MEMDLFEHGAFQNDPILAWNLRYGITSFAPPNFGPGIERGFGFVWK